MHALPEAALAQPRTESLPLPGGVVLVAPHMDDETLGCGALIASHDWAGSMQVVFATDGARSPRRDADPGRSGELPLIRRREAIEAMRVLGIPENDVHFLDLPDSDLQRHITGLRDAIEALVERFRPAYLLVPFRYDRHPDHLAVNRAAATIARDRCDLHLMIVEYFVYAKWRLLPGGDVRSYLIPSRVLKVDGAAVAATKRRAIDCYHSQTTLFYAWQRRPILTDLLVDRVCAEPEVFVVHPPAVLERDVFARSRAWIPVAHRMEPGLKRAKDRMMTWIRR